MSRFTLIAIFSSNGTVVVQVGDVKNTGYKTLKLVTTFPVRKYNYFFKKHIYMLIFSAVNLFIKTYIATYRKSIMN